MDKSTLLTHSNVFKIRINTLCIVCVVHTKCWGNIFSGTRLLSAFGVIDTTQSTKIISCVHVVTNVVTLMQTLVTNGYAIKCDGYGMLHMLLQTLLHTQP